MTRILRRPAERSRCPPAARRLRVHDSPPARALLGSHPAADRRGRGSPASVFSFAALQGASSGYSGYVTDLARQVAEIAATAPEASLCLSGYRGRATTLSLGSGRGLWARCNRCNRAI